MVVIKSLGKDIKLMRGRLEAINVSHPNVVTSIWRNLVMVKADVTVPTWLVESVRDE